MKSRRKKAVINCLLADYGYVYACDGILIQKGVRGFTADTVVRRVFRDVWDVFDYLLPRVQEDDFYNRVRGIRDTS